MISLSIIIPVYKTEKYLRECVDSVLREAPIDSEIILVDDGSPDDCPKICDEYALKDSRIKVIHKRNGGISDARNTGIKNASGKYLYFLDSDDFLSENYFEKLLKFEADLIISNYCAFYTNNLADRKGSFYSKKYNSLHEYLIHFNKYFATIFNFAWGKIYKTSIIKENNIQFEDNISMAEDVLFNVEYYKYCNSICTCENSFVMYRQSQGTLSKTIKLEVFDWYALSYDKIKSLLISEQAFTKENENHFYAHFLQNVLEYVLGILPYGETVCENKYYELANDDMVQTAIDYCYPTKIKHIIKGLKLKNVKIIKKEARKYLLKLKIKKKLRCVYEFLFKNKKCN